MRLHPGNGTHAEGATLEKELFTFQFFENETYIVYARSSLEVNFIFPNHWRMLKDKIGMKLT